MRVMASMDGEATGGNGGGRVDGGGGGDGARDDTCWLATASGGDERPVVSVRGDGARCASSEAGWENSDCASGEASWRNADDIGETGGGGGETGGGGGEASPSAASDLGEARCDGGRAGPTGMVEFGEGGGGSDGGEARGGVDGWEPVLPAVFPVMLHDIGATIQTQKDI